MALIDGLVSAGHEVQGFGTTHTVADALVTLNDQPAARHLQISLELPPERSALIVMEPRVTAPGMYTSRTLRRYQHRFAASQMWAASIGAEPFLWPQRIQMNRIPNPNDSFSATIINGEKRSAIEGSLYGLRRSVIQAFDDAGIPLAVFGPGWDNSVTRRMQEGGKAIARAMRARSRPNVVEALSQPSIHPRHVMGVAENKRDAFALAPITVVVENSPDYVSEKLIDAVCAGVMPMYVGPPLELFDLPRDIAIPVQPNPNDIAEALRRLTPSEIEDVISTGSAWLNSAESRRHDVGSVLFTLGTKIGSRLAQS